MTSLRIPEASSELLASLGEHRVLSTSQVRAIHFPGRSSRRVQQALSHLERAGLVAYVETRRAPRRIWFLTELGAKWVMDAGADRQPKVLNPELAAGPLRAHTLGVNEVGISFLQAARKRGDDFGPLSWRHEVAHPMNRGRGRARRTLIADAVFTYARFEEQDLFIEQRFVEVDRATLSVERLVAELARYGQLEQAREKAGGERLWRYYYRRFPPVICTLTGAPRKALFRRLDVALGLLTDHPALSNRYGDLAIYFCLLDDLKARGPFAPIFFKLDELNHVVGLARQTKGRSRMTATRLGPSAPLLTADEAARLLHVPRSTLYELVRSRGLPHVRIGDRALRFTRADLEEWIAQNTYGTRRNR